MSATPLHNRAETKAPDNYFGSASNEDEEGDDGVLDFGKEETGIETEEESEENVEAEETLKLTVDEEDAIIEDENEILEEIREGKITEIKKSSFPPSDDDEMFFSK
jgi:hypothetical protein